MQSLYCLTVVGLINVQSKELAYTCLCVRLTVVALVIAAVRIEQFKKCYIFLVSIVYLCTGPGFCSFFGSSLLLLTGKPNGTFLVRPKGNVKKSLTFLHLL